MSPTEYETTYRDVLNGRLPSDVVDCHVHAAEVQDFDVGRMSDFAWHHMVSTYPETTLEQSEQKLVSVSAYSRQIQLSSDFKTQYIGINNIGSDEWT